MRYESEEGALRIRLSAALVNPPRDRPQNAIDGIWKCSRVGFGLSVQTICASCNPCYPFQWEKIMLMQSKVLDP